MSFVCPKCAWNVLQLSKEERVELALGLRSKHDGFYQCHSCKKMYTLFTDSNGFKRLKSK